jgi:class 3 adenylate cyclase
LNGKAPNPAAGRKFFMNMVLISLILLLFVVLALSNGWFYRKLKTVRQDAEDRKFKMAEANLKLLEQSELLEAQKFKMAEANVLLLEQKEIIERERERSEKLLRNVLPDKVADELKQSGKTEPETFDQVTVYFSDLVGFTDKSSRLEPKILIAELNEIFTAFDHIVEKHQCERIKTIGDAYLCVSGMPVKDSRHADNIVQAAREIIDYLRDRNGKSKIKWEVRIGVHSGKVVGGVVGVKKYIYDVFGDTINTASRMEANSEPMKINVSEATYRLIKDKYSFLEREPFEIKGKGVLKMYFLNH